MKDDGGIVEKVIAAIAMSAAAAGAFKAARTSAAISETEPEAPDPLSDPGQPGDDEPVALSSGFHDTDKAPPPLVVKLDEVQKGSTPFGFAWAVLKKFSEDKAGYLAALVGYFGFFSIFPLLIAMVSVLGFVLDDNPDLREDIADSAFDQIPIVGNTLARTIDDVEGSGVIFVIGILAALWAGLKIVDAAQNAMNDVWDLPRDRKVKLVKRRAKGLATLVLLFVGLVGGIAVSAVVSLLPDIPGAGRLAVVLGTIALNMGLYTVLFKVQTEVKLPWRAHLPGGMLAGFFWWVMQTFGVIYLSRVEESAGPTYGSFASTIVLLTFIFVSAQLIVLSAEVSVVSYRRLWPRALPRCEITEADRRAWQSQAESTRQVPAQRITSEV